MNNIEECQVVQDLLQNYSDGVLNEESKKLVENHLKTCSKCQKKLEKIKKDTEPNLQKKEIEYLKKIKRKSDLKTISIILLILFFTVFIYFLRNFIILSTITDKSFDFFDSNNLYKETRQYTGNGNEVIVWKEYYKDSKYKKVTEKYFDDKSEVLMEEYAILNEPKRVNIYPQNNSALVLTGETYSQINSKQNLTHLTEATNEFSIPNRLILSLTSLITIDAKNVGRDYYKIENPFSVKWIDKETGLIIRNYTLFDTVSFYEGTDIIKETNSYMYEFRFSKDTVTDEDVTIPDLSEYKIEYVNDTDNISE